MKGRILVLDDSNTFRRELASVLETQFEVVIVQTRADALALCEHWLPDTIVLDIENLADGIEACRELSAINDVPVVFAASTPSLEIQVAALEAGACDMLAKPVEPQPLLHKIRLAIHNRHKYLQSEAERTNLQSMAMGFLSSLGQSGTLMNFVRASIRCKTHQELADMLMEAVRELGITCFGEIRQSGGLPVRFSSDGASSELEEMVMAKLTSMGRIFQFSSRLVVNFPQVSIVVINLPKDSDEQAGKIRDNIAILAETADALCENVEMRKNASAHAEQLQLAMMQANTGAISLRDNTKQMLLDVRLLLQELEDNVHRAHSWLGTTSDQEAAISAMMDDSIQAVLQAISRVNVDEQMDAILQTMSVGSSDNNDLELF